MNLGLRGADVAAVGAGSLTTGAFAAAFFAAHRAFNAAIRRLFPSGDMWPLRDAVSAHKTQAVKEFLEQNPRVRFHFTPTYSSWLNRWKSGLPKSSAMSLLAVSLLPSPTFHAS